MEERKQYYNIGYVKTLPLTRLTQAPHPHNTISPFFIKQKAPRSLKPRLEVVIFVGGVGLSLSFPGKA